MQVWSCASELYWERDEEGKRLPYLEAIHVDVVQDMGAEFLGLTQGATISSAGCTPHTWRLCWTRWVSCGLALRPP